MFLAAEFELKLINIVLASEPKPVILPPTDLVSVEADADGRGHTPLSLNFIHHRREAGGIWY